MSFAEELRLLLETEEARTVGTSFGAATGTSRSFSVPTIRNWLNTNHQITTAARHPCQDKLSLLSNRLDSRTFKAVISSAVRFSFLIELTDLKVGSTKMKTRWLPGLILMPQDGSFEPIRGTFQTGNDPRSSSFQTCLEVFDRVLDLTLQQIDADPQIIAFLGNLKNYPRVPYEYPIGYINPSLDPVHTPSNTTWIANNDIAWLIRAREVLANYTQQHADAITRIKSTKLEVKVYKTDRALTGKDKTNRAKRWEVLFGDFQFACLSDCWSVEKKLTEDLVFFDNFPASLQMRFINAGLVSRPPYPTRCPVTLAPLDFIPFAAATLSANHGRSDYQVGHLTPLKRGGRHIGNNVAWQSADGNRIQGDLTLDETIDLLNGIAQRRRTLNI